MALIRSLENNQNRAEHSFGTKGVHLVDQLKNLSNAVKETQVQLNQLVSGGNTTVTLSPENPTDIEVISMNSIIVKVELKDHTGPL